MERKKLLTGAGALFLVLSMLLFFGSNAEAGLKSYGDTDDLVGAPGCNIDEDFPSIVDTSLIRSFVTGTVPDCVLSCQDVAGPDRLHGDVDGAGASWDTVDTNDAYAIKMFDIYVINTFYNMPVYMRKITETVDRTVIPGENVTLTLAARNSNDEDVANTEVEWAVTDGLAALSAVSFPTPSCTDTTNSELVGVSVRGPEYGRATITFTVDPIAVGGTTIQVVASCAGVGPLPPYGNRLDPIPALTPLVWNFRVVAVPVISITQPTPGSTLCAADDSNPVAGGFQSNVTVSTSAEQGEIVTLYVGATTATPLTASQPKGATPWVTFNDITLPQGAATLWASATYGVGDIVYYGPALYNVDSSPPTIIITAPPLGGVMSNSNVVVSGTVTDVGLGVAQVWCDLYEMPGSVWTASVAGSFTGGAWSCTFLGLPDRTELAGQSYRVVAIAEDVSCANQGQMSSIFYVDTTIPDIAVVSPTVGATPPLLCSGETAPVSWQIVNRDWPFNQVFNITSGQVICGLPPLPGLQLTPVTCTVPAFRLNPGPNTLIARACTDATCSAFHDQDITAPYILDIDMPTIAITGPTAGVCVTTDWVTVTGTAEDLTSGVALVKVNGVTATLVPDPVPPGAVGTWSVMLTGLTQGINPIVATADDATGCPNRSTTSIEVRIDAVPPVVSIINPSNGAVLGVGDDQDPLTTNTLETVVTVTTDVEDGQIVTVIVNGASIFTAAASAGQAQVNVSLPASACTNTITAQTTDVCGNASLIDSVTVNADLSVPQLTITSPLPGVCVQGTNVVVTVDYTDTCTGLAVIAVNGTTVDVSAAPLGGTANVTIGPWQGNLNLVATAADGAGNSASSPAVGITLDGIPPTIAITNPASTLLGVSDDDDPVAPGIQITVTVTTDAEDGNTVTVTINGAPVVGFVSGGAASVPVTLTACTNDIVASVSDLCGNGPATDGLAVTADSSVPELTITSPLPGVCVQGTSVVVTVDYTDTCTGLTEIAVNGVTVDVSAAPFGGSAVVNIAGQGALNLVATAVDGAGNSASSPAVGITLDGIPPTIAITNPASTLLGVSDDDDPVAPGIQITVTVTTDAEDGNTVTVTINGAPVVGFVSGGAASVPVTLSACTNDIVASVSDLCNNGPATDGLAVTADSSVPELSISSPLPGVCIQSDYVLVTVDYTDTCTGLVALSVNGETVDVSGDPFGPAQAIVNLGPVQGTLVIVATAVDGAGNSASSPAVAITLDGTTPTITITNPTSGVVLNNASDLDGDPTNGLQTDVTVVTDAEDGQVVTLTVGAVTYGAAVSNGDVQFNNIDLGEPASCNVTLSADVSDLCLNPADTASVTVTVDLGPAISITSPTDGWTVCPTFVVSGTVTDLCGGVIISVNGVTTGPFVGAGVSWSVTLGSPTPMANGYLVITANAQDPSGNLASDSVQVYVDAVAPFLQFLPVQLPPVVQAPNGFNIYSGLDTSACDGNIYDPAYIDPGVPAQYDFGLGNVRRASPGDIVTIPLNINMGGEDLYSVNITVTYDTTELEYLGASGFDPALPVALQGQCEAPDAPEAPAGQINYNQDCQLNVVTGIQNIANLCFRVLSGTVRADISITPNLIYQEPDPPGGTDLTAIVNVFNGYVEVSQVSGLDPITVTQLDDMCNLGDGSIELEFVVQTDAPDGLDANILVNGITDALASPAPVSGGFVTFSCVTLANGPNSVAATINDGCQIGITDPPYAVTAVAGVPVNITSPIAGSCIPTQYVDVTVQSDTADGGTVTLKVDGGTANCLVPPCECTIPPGGGSCTVTDVDMVGEGSGKWIDAKLTEPDSQFGVGTVSNLTVDWTDPTVDITSPLAGTCVNNANVVVGGTVTEASSYTIAITMNGYTASGASFPITIFGVTDGTYAITAEATDFCGNLGPQDIEFPVQVDATPPLAPAVAPANGTYCVGTTITVTTDEGGPEHCTTDGSAPDCASPAAPAAINANMTLRCIECDGCGNLGAETVRNYTVDVAGPLAPAVAPANGTYCVGTTISVTTDEGGAEHCTTDGSAPDCLSPAAPAAINADMTLRCIECDGCGNLGAETLRNYTVDVTGPIAPTISPTSGSYCSGEPITVTTDEGGAEHCTTDGSAPNCASPAAPATITADITLRCIECDGCGNLGAEAPPAVYTVDVTGPVAPTISPTSGTYCSGEPITVTTAEGGAEHCTTDGSAPGCASPAAPATITADITLRCVECDTCGNLGAEAPPAVYTVDTTGPGVTITQPTTGEIIPIPTVVVKFTAVDGGSGVDNTSGVITLAPYGSQAATFSAGVFTATFPGVADGSYTATACVDDNCPNTGCSSVDFTVFTAAIASLVIDSPLSGANIVMVNGLTRGSTIPYIPIEISVSAAAVLPIDFSGMTIEVNGVFDDMSMMVVWGNTAAEGMIAMPSIDDMLPDGDGLLPVSVTITVDGIVWDSSPQTLLPAVTVVNTLQFGHLGFADTNADDGAATIDVPLNVYADPTYFGGGEGIFALDFDCTWDQSVLSWNACAAASGPIAWPGEWPAAPVCTATVGQLRIANTSPGGVSQGLVNVGWVTFDVLGSLGDQTDINCDLYMGNPLNFVKTGNVPLPASRLAVGRVKVVLGPLAPVIDEVCDSAEPADCNPANLPLAAVGNIDINGSNYDCADFTVNISGACTNLMNNPVSCTDTQIVRQVFPSGAGCCDVQVINNATGLSDTCVGCLCSP